MKYGLIVTAIVFTVFTAGYSLLDRQNSIDSAYIETVLRSCLEQNNSITVDTCLKSGIRSLLTQTSASSVMRFIVATTTPQSVVSQCHIIAHVVGEESLIMNNTLEGALASCTRACNYGCIHGAVAADVAKSFGETYPGDDIVHAESSEIEALGRKYCDRSQDLCHGMGHIARIASDTLLEALATCDVIAPDEYQYSCFNGVFMEDFGRIAFVPQATQLERPDDYGYPCNALPDRYVSDCYYQLRDYQRARFDANGIPGPQRLAISKSVCAALKDTRRHDCFAGLGYKLDRELDARGNVSHDGPAICASLAPADRVSCMKGLVFNYAAFSRHGDAVAYCDTQPVPSERTLCYDNLFQHATVAPQQLSDICATTGSTVCIVELNRYVQSISVGS